MTTVAEKEIRYEHSAKEVASIIKRLGHPVSTILLDSPCCFFQTPEVEGVIGYQLVKNCAVVLGDPICLPENLNQLTSAFQNYCKELKVKVIYFLVSHSFAHWAMNNGCNTAIQTGEELIIDPTAYQKQQKLRWKVKQAIKQGVVIKECNHFDPSMENEIKKTINTWLKEKKGPQIHLGDLSYFATGNENRIFYAMQNHKMMGLLKLSPIDRFEGWALSFSLTLTEAPVGTSEHLMCSAFDTLARENCHFLCLGAIAGLKLGEMIGLSSFERFLANVIFKFSKSFFKLDAKKIYLFKYQPSLFPTYFLTSGKLTFNDLMAIKEVLNVRLCFQ